MFDPVATTTPLIRILGDAIRQASRSDRRIFASILVTWLVFITLQVWDVSGRSGPGVVAELFGAVVLVSGVLLLALTWTLHAQLVRDETAGASRRAPKAIVLALPVLASISATCFGFAAAMYLLRGVLGADRWFVVTVSVLVVLVLTLPLQLVARTTRSLYHWAHTQAALTASAEAAAERARLAALQAQMNPHFLFNALNTVAALVTTDPGRAERTVENLASVLRKTLDRSTRALSTVEEEVTFVREYLGVERERFGARLDVTFDVSPDTLSLTLPTMSLQPLVENAIKHAIVTRLAGGRIRVGTVVEGDRLTVSVTDDGEGFAAGSREGTGLGNLRARLRALYGSSGDLVIESAPTGTCVSIAVPADDPIAR